VLAGAAGLSFAACSSSGVGFTEPGVGGSGQAGRAGAGDGEAGAGRGGAPSRAGAGGGAPRGGNGGEAGELAVAGRGGAPNGGSSGGAGAPNGGAPNGGAPNGGAPNGGTPNGGAPNGGAPNGGAPNGGAPNGGAPNGGGGAGGGVNPNPVCGNQLLESGEQCDDGNAVLLDGCNSSCAFEQSQRANWFKVQFDPDAFCSANAFGAAFPAITRPTLTQSTDARVADGSFSLLFAFLGLADPKGPNGSAFSLGMLNGSPLAGNAYNGASDLDWWYTPAPSAIDADRNPVSKLSAQISAGVMLATGAKLQLPLFSSVPLNVSNAMLRLSIGASSKPLTSTGAPPGHLTAEHLSPTLTSFASGGVPSDAGAGELCGNLSAASLKAEPIPPAFVSGGATPCLQGYAGTSTFLDVVVGGCTVSVQGFPVTALIATQPDQVDLSATSAGAGGPYKLFANAAHVVNACRDKSNVAVNLAACLSAAAYSSAFKFATDRVIIK
jgi:cysteine-rich repeat protein